MLTCGGRELPLAIACKAVHLHGTWKDNQPVISVAACTQIILDHPEYQQQAVFWISRFDSETVDKVEVCVPGPNWGQQ